MLPIAMLALSGCSDWERKFPPAKDYCERLQKNIPENEKKAIILTKMYYGSQGPDYIYQHVIHIIDKNATRSDVHKEIRKYIEKNPLCCQILRPDHLGS
jgi:translation initiation factor 2 beta subunit (eIF-2beta)/eIF-5